MNSFKEVFAYKYSLYALLVTPIILLIIMLLRGVYYVNSSLYYNIFNFYFSLKNLIPVFLVIFLIISFALRFISSNTRKHWADIILILILVIIYMTQSYMSTYFTNNWNESSVTRMVQNNPQTGQLTETMVYQDNMGMSATPYADLVTRIIIIPVLFLISLFLTIRYLILEKRFLNNTNQNIS